mmetsp:Transcript_7793/g.21814  ORF Transcript_7793/g.21814 Transcript_7793/m.21814 type:complete len:235 (-) Transcript_7793:2992-3696(-)
MLHAARVQELHALRDICGPEALQIGPHLRCPVECLTDGSTGHEFHDEAEERRVRRDDAQHRNRPRRAETDHDRKLLRELGDHLLALNRGQRRQRYLLEGHGLAHVLALIHVALRAARHRLCRDAVERQLVADQVGSFERASRLLPRLFRHRRAESSDLFLDAVEPGAVALHSRLDGVDAPLAALCGGHDEFLVASRPGLDRSQKRRVSPRARRDCPRDIVELRSGALRPRFCSD